MPVVIRETHNTGVARLPRLQNGMVQLLRRPRTASAISATVVLVWSEVPEPDSLSTDEKELDDRRKTESAVDPAAVEHIDDG